LNLRRLLVLSFRLLDLLELVIRLAQLGNNL